MAVIQEAVLALVAREPSHGYAIWQKLQSLSADPDSVQSSSVYMAIKRLVKAGAIEKLGQVPDRVPGERPRFVLGLKEPGQKLLDQWLAQPPSSVEELRLRIAVSRPADEFTGLISWVAAELAETQKRLGAAPGNRERVATGSAWENACALALAALEFRELSARAQSLAEAHAQLHKLRDLAQTQR